MKLEALFQGIPTKTPVFEATITDLARDSRQAGPGSVFFAIPGAQHDGHDFAAMALEAGAQAVVVQRDMNLPRQIVVEDTHLAYGLACGNFHGNPARQLQLLAVTGTNGKTTTAYIVRSILEHAGYTTGLIGTVENCIGSISLQARHTTPDPNQLHGLFARMVQAGCTHVVMEASSHALDQHRMAGLTFAASAFTNLTKDHLDYHHTMDAYFQAKAALFAMSQKAVVNGEDAYGKRLIHELSLPVTTFSVDDSQGDLWAKEISFSQKGSHFTMVTPQGEIPVDFVQPGRFSVANALCAAGLCLAVGLTEEQVAAGLVGTPEIPGRFETIPTETNYTVVRDFAHSAAGLENVLSTVREFHQQRLIVVFGCAGERDRTKRPDMARAVARYADMAIMTADNPRQEPIAQIISDALPGFEGGEGRCQYQVVENRFDAIRQALDLCQPGDFLILCGKGHEDYQVLDYGSINFNEKELVVDLLSRK